MAKVLHVRFFGVSGLRKLIRVYVNSPIAIKQSFNLWEGRIHNISPQLRDFVFPHLKVEGQSGSSWDSLNFPAGAGRFPSRALVRSTTPFAGDPAEVLLSVSRNRVGSQIGGFVMGRPTQYSVRSIFFLHNLCVKVTICIVNIVFNCKLT